MSAIQNDLNFNQKEPYQNIFCAYTSQLLIRIKKNSSDLYLNFREGEPNLNIKAVGQQS